MIRFLREVAAVAVCVPLGALLLPLILAENYKLGSRLWSRVEDLGDMISGFNR